MVLKKYGEISELDTWSVTAYSNMFTGATAMEEKNKPEFKDPSN